MEGIPYSESGASSNPDAFGNTYTAIDCFAWMLSYPANERSPHVDSILVTNRVLWLPNQVGLRFRVYLSEEVWMSELSVHAAGFNRSHCERVCEEKRYILRGQTAPNGVGMTEVITCSGFRK